MDGRCDSKSLFHMLHQWMQHPRHGSLTSLSSKSHLIPHLELYFQPFLSHRNELYAYESRSCTGTPLIKIGGKCEEKRNQAVGQLVLIAQCFATCEVHRTWHANVHIPRRSHLCTLRAMNAIEP